jgi:hypothetical protein
MILQTAIRHIPKETMGDVVAPLIEEAAGLSQRDVQDRVNQLKTQFDVQYRPAASQKQRRATEALRKLNLIDRIEANQGPVRTAVEAVLLRSAELLGTASAQALLGRLPESPRVGRTRRAVTRQQRE